MGRSSVLPCIKDVSSLLVSVYFVSKFPSAKRRIKQTKKITPVNVQTTLFTDSDAPCAFTAAHSLFSSVMKSTN